MPSRMGYSRKYPNRGVEDILFWKASLEILDLSLYPKKFQRKKAFTPWNSAKLCDTPWKFQSQKPRPTEIPHSPGISTSFHFLIDPWNFHVFSSRLREIPCPQPRLFGFLWNSPMYSYTFSDDKCSWATVFILLHMEQQSTS